jgi:hypothetical protein
MSLLVRRPSQKRTRRFFIGPKKKMKLTVLSQAQFRSFVRLPRIDDCFQAIPQLTRLRSSLKIETLREKPKVDDTLSRMNLWKTLFGEEEMPEIEKGAVEKYAGSLDKYLPSGFQLDEIIKKVRKGKT